MIKQAKLDKESCERLAKEKRTDLEYWEKQVLKYQSIVEVLKRAKKYVRS
jgi:hypothetical protein